MNSARLLRLADHLDTIERKDFDFCDNEKCAMGQATRLPYFKRLGLKLISGEIVFKNYKQRYAAAEIFDITPYNAAALFCVEVPQSVYKKKPTPKQVAKAIRRFVNDQVNR